MPPRKTGDGGEIAVVMTWRKNTKGTQVYQAVDPDALITTLYVSRRGAKVIAPNGKEYPERITLHVSPE